MYTQSLIHVIFCRPLLVLQVYLGPEAPVSVLRVERHPAVCDAECAPTVCIPGAAPMWRESFTKHHSATLLHRVPANGIGQHASDLHQCANIG